MSNGFVYIAASNGAQFSNAASNDFLFYTQSNSQKLLFGVAGGNALGQANLTISSNLTSFNGDIAITNGVSIRGLTISQSDGTTANVSSVGLPGYSNDSVGVVMSVASNTSNYSFRFTSTSNTLMAVRGDGLLDAYNVQVRSNVVAPSQSNGVWDMAGACSTWSGSGQGGPVAASNIGAGVTVSLNTPFSNLTTEGSIVLPGTAGGYIHVAGMGSPAAPSNVALPDFTVEGWVYLPSTPANATPNLIGQMTPATGLNYWSFGVDNTNKISFYAANNGAACFVTGGTVSNLTWTHIAACYTSNAKTLQVFINGLVQTITVSGTAVTGSGTTMATYTAANTGGAQLTVGQYNSVPLAANVSCLRLCQGFIYSSNFTPQAAPLAVIGSNQTRLLLRAPLNSVAAASCAIDSARGLRARCLPGDAFAYADCYGATSASVNSYSNAPFFDSNVSQAIIFNRTNSNVLSMAPQTINTTTRGFSFLMKTRMTGNAVAWEDLFMISGSNSLIYFERYSTNNQIQFGLRNTAIAGDLYITTPSNVLQNQVNVFAGRYDPYVAGGTLTLYMNGSNVASSSNNCTNIRDAAYATVSIGSSAMNLNADIYCCAFYNRALTDREIADSTALLMDRPNTANSLEVGSSVSGKPSLVVREDGGVQVAGPLVGANSQAWSATDIGVSNLAVQGYVVGTVLPVGMSPYASRAGDGSLYFNGSVGSYVVFPSGVANPYVGGVQDATFESWVYLTQTANINMVMGRASSPSSGVNDWGIYVNNTTLVSYVYGANNNQYVASHHVAFPTNTWCHVAMTVASGVVRVFLNGLLGTTTATIVGNARYNAAYNTFVGCFNNTANNMFYGYMANLRIVSGLAAYTANFTPPSAPLAPVTSNTTLLCMRVQQRPGRVIAPRIGGTTTLQAYPPVALGSNVVNVQNATYGTGTYVVMSSTENPSNYGYMAFDQSASTFWASTQNYNTSSPFGPTSTTSTLERGGTVYTGDWLQITMPVSLVVSSFTVTARNDAGYPQAPGGFTLLGSPDGTSWTVLSRQSGLSWTTGQLVSFNTNNTVSYTVFRIVVEQVSSASASGYASIASLVLYGTEESINITPDGQVGIGVSQPRQALEVAGNAVFYGSISAPNLGMFRNRIINGNMFVNQRSFTSAALTVTSTGTTFFVDRWRTYVNGTAGTLTVATQTLTASDAPLFQAGHMYSLRATATIACSFNDTTMFGYPVENLYLLDLGWGTVSGVPITVSFWFRSNAVGLHSFAMRNNAPGGGSFWAAYTGSFNYPVSGVWQYVTITVPPPPLGSKWNMTYTTASDTGLALFFFVPSTQYVSAVANTWYYNVTSPLSAYEQAGGTINWAATAGNYVELTGVQLEKGTVATPFEFRPYPVELRLCQRYCVGWRGSGNCNIGTGFTGPAATQARLVIPVPVSMRAAPTLTTYGSTYVEYLVGNTQTAGYINTGNQGGTTYSPDCGNTIGLVVGLTASVTVNLPIAVMKNSGAGNYMIADAEL